MRNLGFLGCQDYDKSPTSFGKISTYDLGIAYKSARFAPYAKLRFICMDGIAQSDRDDLDQRVGDLANHFLSSGFRFFLVGGVVRDLFLGKRSDDIDITTNASPEDSDKVLQTWADVVWRQGERFGTIGARKGDVTVEVTTHRSEHYVDSSRKPQVLFSESVLDDLKRRDFTVNAMAIEMPTWDLVDPFNGRGDLARRVLRTPLGPETAFSEDPLRMLRAARFVARYSLKSEETLENAIFNMATRIGIVSKERISDEMAKFLVVEQPSTGLALLQRTGLLSEIIPSLKPTGKIEPEALDRTTGEIHLRWAALLWPLTQDARQVRQLLRELRMSKALSARVGAIIDAGRELSLIRNKEAPTLRRAMHLTHPYMDSALALLNAHQQMLDPQILKALRKLEKEEGSGNFELPLDGYQVTQLIGEEGPLVGSMLQRLLETRIERGPLSEEQAKKLILDWKSEQ